MRADQVVDMSLIKLSCHLLESFPLRWKEGFPADVLYFVDGQPHNFGNGRIRDILPRVLGRVFRPIPQQNYGFAQNFFLTVRHFLVFHVFYNINNIFINNLTRVVLY